MASVYLKSTEVSREYGHRKVWRQRLEVAIKIKGSQGNRRGEWVKPEHPYTAISDKSVINMDRQPKQQLRHEEIQGIELLKPEFGQEKESQPQEHQVDCDGAGANPFDLTQGSTVISLSISSILQNTAMIKYSIENMMLTANGVSPIF